MMCIIYSTVYFLSVTYYYYMSCTYQQAVHVGVGEFDWRPSITQFIFLGPNLISNLSKIVTHI